MAIKLTDFIRKQSSIPWGILLFVISYSCVSCTEKTAGVSETMVPEEGGEEMVEKSTEPVRFLVDEVESASSRKAEFPFKVVFEDRISKEVYQMSETDTAAKLVPAGMNAFVQCVHDAYSEHRALSISPDDVWMLIAQGFSIHANKQMDHLESEMFVSEKPETLVVRNDALLEETREAWESLVQGLSERVREYAQPELYTTMVPTFSTTTATERTAYEVTMLETASKVFTYAGESGCGIPSIRLEGTAEDWKLVRDGFKKLSTYGLDEWYKGLDPVLEEFVKASEGEINKSFWQAIYKESIHYNAFYISGWIWKFFPYIRSYSIEPEGIYESFDYIPNEYLLGDSYAECTLDTRSFPSGISKAKVLWNIHDPATGSFVERKEMLVCAGFVGLSQEEDLTLSPCIGWAVCHENSEDPEHILKRRRNARPLEHKEADWIGEVLTDPDTKPIYAPDRNKSYEEGIDYLKEHLATKAEENIDGMDISFKVSWMGTVYDVEATGASKELCHQIEKYLISLPERWQPAESIIHEPGYDENTSYKVNYKVFIE